MKPEPIHRLHDALDACRELLVFTSGRGFDDYQRDPMLRAAVERKLEIVGEALRKAMTGAPWIESRIPDARRIIATRNHIVHEYDALDDGLLWDAACYKIPELAALLEYVIAENQPAPEPES